MTMMASPAQSKQILAARSDFNGRRHATRAEIYEALEDEARARGVQRKLNADLFENTLAVYGHIRRWAAGGNVATLTKPQVVRDTGMSEMTVRRCMKKLEHAGLLTTTTLTSKSGKYRGLRVELLPVNEMMARTRARSSAGSCVGVRIRIDRRKLTAQEACESRIRPRCPRAGRGAPRLFQKPVPLFSPEEVVTSGGRGGGALKGLSSPSSDNDLGCVRASRSPGQVSVDARQRGTGTDVLAALERRRTAALGREALRALSVAESAFLGAFKLDLLRGMPRASEPAMLLAGRLSSVATAQRLLWALRRLDRYADFGAGRQGAGLELLLDRIAGYRQDLDAGIHKQPPGHLGYFLPEMLATGRRWKHTWAPRIKAERESRGARAPHARAPFTPKPALGRAPRAPRAWVMVQGKKWGRDPGAKRLGGRRG